VCSPDFIFCPAPDNIGSAVFGACRKRRLRRRPEFAAISRMNIPRDMALAGLSVVIGRAAFGG
jgi:hypothetical protein